MKIRTGFVSNSSSSSFLILGFKFNKEECIEFFKRVEKEYDEDSWIGDNIEDLLDFISEKCGETISYTSNVTSDDDNEEIYIGLGNFVDDWKIHGNEISLDGSNAEVLIKLKNLLFEEKEKKVKILIGREGM